MIWSQNIRSNQLQTSQFQSLWQTCQSFPLNLCCMLDYLEFFIINDKVPKYEKQPTSNFTIAITMTKLLHAWLFGIFSWKVAWGCKEFWDYFFPVKSKSFSVVLPPHLLLYFRRDFRLYPYPWSLRGSRLQFKSCPPIIWSFHSKMVIIDRVLALEL